MTIDGMSDIEITYAEDGTAVVIWRSDDGVMDYGSNTMTFGLTVEQAKAIHDILDEAQFTDPRLTEYYEDRSASEVG